MISKGKKSSRGAGSAEGRKKNKKKKRIRFRVRFFVICGFLILLLAGISWALLFLFGGNLSGEFPKLTKREELALQISEVPVWRAEKDVVEKPALEDYIKCVVSAEMPAAFEMEALKAQAVCARTYCVERVLRFEQSENAKGHEKAPLCDTTHCQVYKNKEEIEKSRNAVWMQAYWPRICEAADATRGEVLCYQGELAGQALFHSSSGGRTENSEDVFVSAVPYLRSVESPYEDDATHVNEEKTISIEEFTALVNNSLSNVSISGKDAANLCITKRSEGDHVQEVRLGNFCVSGRDIRNLLHLPSANFTVRVENGQITFISKGYGHGVGMSQYGADGMAKRGYSYEEILKHYYTGVEIQRLMGSLYGEADGADEADEN